MLKFHKTKYSMTSSILNNSINYLTFYMYLGTGCLLSLISKILKINFSSSVIRRYQHFYWNTNGDWLDVQYTQNWDVHFRCSTQSYFSSKLKIFCTTMQAFAHRLPAILYNFSQKCFFLNLTTGVQSCVLCIFNTNPICSASINRNRNCPCTIPVEKEQTNLKSHRSMQHYFL